MRSRKLDGDTYVRVFETGEDPRAGLARFAGEQDLSACGFTAIGAFSEAGLG